MDVFGECGLWLWRFGMMKYCDKGFSRRRRTLCMKLHTLECLMPAWKCWIPGSLEAVNSSRYWILQVNEFLEAGDGFLGLVFLRPQNGCSVRSTEMKILLLRSKLVITQQSLPVDKKLKFTWDSQLEIDGEEIPVKRCRNLPGMCRYRSKIEGR